MLKRNKKFIVMVLVLLGMMVIGTAYAATIQIDDFTNTTLPGTMSITSGMLGFADGDTLTGVIGGERDLRLFHTGGSGAVSLNIDAGLQRLAFASAPGTSGSFIVTWDGNDDSPATRSYLLGADLTDGGVNDNLMLSVYADQVGWSMQVDVYTDAANVSSFSFTENDDIRTTGRVYLMPFADFAGTANFANVGAVEITVTGVDDLDLTIDFFTSVDVDENLFDFGDLPAVYGNTTLVNNGAGHLNPGTTIQLGALVDSEVDGQPSADASADGADEDGVAFTGVWNDNTGDVDVTVGGAVNGCLSAWLDWHDGGFAFNPDGDFNDALENIIDNQPVSPGVNSFSFTVLGFDSTQTLFARFRLVPDRDNDGVCTDQAAVLPTGLTQDGEVEDYDIGFTPTAVNLQGITVDNQTTVVPFVIGATLLLLISAGLIFKRKRQTING